MRSHHTSQQQRGKTKDTQSQTSAAGLALLQDKGSTTKPHLSAQFTR